VRPSSITDRAPREWACGVLRQHDAYDRGSVAHLDAAGAHVLHDDGGEADNVGDCVGFLELLVLLLVLLHNLVHGVFGLAEYVL